MEYYREKIIPAISEIVNAVLIIMKFLIEVIKVFAFICSALNMLMFFCTKGKDKTKIRLITGRIFVITISITAT